MQKEVETLRLTDTALQTAKDQAEHANRAKTRYVAGMTHELRTPLNSILGYLQILLKEESLERKQREALQTIHRSSVHMASLVDDLLNLAQIESGRLRLETAPRRHSKKVFHLNTLCWAHYPVGSKAMLND